jgi:OmpA-OmpF porin, OOP family
MKKLLFCLLMIMVLPSLALATQASSNLAVNNQIGYYTHGIYIGGQLGYLDLHNKHANAHDAAALMLPFLEMGDNMGSRVYAGYRFNDYLAVEGGYNGFANQEETGGASNVKNHTKMRAFDVSAKGIWPLSKIFSLYCKVGYAYVHQDILDSTNGGATVIYKDESNKFLPIIGGGVNVNFTRSFAMDLTWTHMFPIDEIHAIDFGSLGLSYTF